jgi:hypothetical protein
MPFFAGGLTFEQMTGLATKSSSIQSQQRQSLGVALQRVHECRWDLHATIPTSVFVGPTF